MCRGNVPERSPASARGCQMKPKSEPGVPQGVAPNSSSGGRPQNVAARRLLTLREAADVLSLSVASVRRLVWTGRLRFVRLNRRIRIDVHDLDRLIQEAKT
jgi:excisionase family DNA binding protein